MCSLAEQLMHELQRHRSGERGIADAARSFIQAIEHAVDAPKGDRRKIAASVFRLDVLLLDRLDEFQQQSGQRDVSPAIGQAASVRALLPELVRQIARIEAGQCVAVLSFQFVFTGK